VLPRTLVAHQPLRPLARELAGGSHQAAKEQLGGEAGQNMGIVPSLIVVAIGAILDFAITVTNSHGVNLHTIGVILMIVGGIGFLLSLVFWGSWGGFHRPTSALVSSTRRQTVVHDGDVV